MKLFIKEVDKQLFAQYPKGSDLDNQMVVAKIFNPYGRGVYYLLNSDPNDPDYIWAIVDLFEPDMGSVSRSELQTVKLPPFGLGFERDIYFTPKPAKEVWEGVMRGERFAHGGMTAGRYYKDNSGKEFRFIGESEGKLLFKDGEKIITKSEEDFEDAPKEKKLFGIFAEGGETKDEGVDLFEDYDDIPANVQKVLQKYDFEEGDYRTLEKAKKDVEKVGYTFEYSLDGTAYDLRKIGQKGKSEDEYAKGGVVKYYDKDNEYKIGRPSGYIEKEILERVSHNEQEFVGSFGWKTSMGKMAEGYLYNLNDFDKNLVKDIKLKQGEKIFRYLNRTTAIGGMRPFIKINVDKALIYFLVNLQDDGIEFETRGIQANYIALIAHKMAKGGMMEHGLRIGDKVTTDMFWDNQIVVENQKTKKRAQINLETGERKEEMAMGGDTAAAEHNIKQAKYGARLVGKQKNLDVNKNGKLDAEDFKMLRGEKMAMGGNTEKAFEVILKNPNGGMTEKAILLAKTKEDASRKALNLKQYKQYGYVIRNVEEIKYAMGGKVKFEDKVKAVKESLLKRKKVSPKVQKDYGKTYDRKEALEAAKRIVGAQTAKYELKKKFKKGGKTIAQTPAPKKDRVFGSSKNKEGSASSKKAASNIELNESILKTLSQKAKEYNEKHSNKVSVSTLKAVMRRGMGAFSSSHRPGMTRQGWGYARVNKFLLKKGGSKVKAAYVQDDDLMEKGGELKKEMRVSEQTKYKKLQELENKISHSRNRAKNFMNWSEGIGANYQDKWNKMVKRLRGWDDYSPFQEQKSKPEWVEYCKEQGIVEDYNFGDVLA